VIYIGKEKLNISDKIIENNLNYKYKIIDIHNIDCENLIKIDKPEALILAVLCDFKNKKEKDVLLYLAKRLKQISKNSNEFKNNMLMLETLSGNRNLKNTFIEVEKMLSVIDWENLPSYAIGMEKGMERGMERGAYKNAVVMITKYNLDPATVAKDFNISYAELRKRLDN